MLLTPLFIIILLGGVMEYYMMEYHDILLIDDYLLCLISIKRTTVDAHINAYGLFTVIFCSPVTESFLSIHVTTIRKIF